MKQFVHLLLNNYSTLKKNNLQGSNTFIQKLPIIINCYYPSTPALIEKHADTTLCWLIYNTIFLNIMLLFHVWHCFNQLVSFLYFCIFFVNNSLWFCQCITFSMLHFDFCAFLYFFFCCCQHLDLSNVGVKTILITFSHGNKIASLIIFIERMSSKSAEAFEHIFCIRPPRLSHWSLCLSLWSLRGFVSFVVRRLGACYTTPRSHSASRSSSGVRSLPLHVWNTVQWQFPRTKEAAVGENKSVTNSRVLRAGAKQPQQLTTRSRIQLLAICFTMGEALEQRRFTTPKLTAENYALRVKDKCSEYKYNQLIG